MSGGGYSGYRHLPGELAAQLLERDHAKGAAELERCAPTPDEERALQRAIDEALEVAHAANKVLQFGWSANPHTKVTSREALSIEIGQLWAAIDSLADARMFDAQTALQARRRKLDEYRRGVAGELPVRE